MTDQDQPAPTTETRREEWVVQDAHHRTDDWSDYEEFYTEAEGRETLRKFNRGDMLLRYRLIHRITMTTETVVSEAP